MIPVRPPPQLRPRPIGSALVPRSLSLQLGAQERPRPTGSALVPRSLSLQFTGVRQERPLPIGSAFWPRSLSLQPELRQERPLPTGSAFWPPSLSLQPDWNAKASPLTAARAPAPATPPATVPRNERRLSLRVGFIIVPPRWRRGARRTREQYHVRGGSPATIATAAQGPTTSLDDPIGPAPKLAIRAANPI